MPGRPRRRAGGRFAGMTVSGTIDEFASLREAIAGVCQSEGVPNPAAWLAHVMAGRDPRPMQSPLIQIVRKIAYRAFDGGSDLPDQDEWTAIVEHVLGSGLYESARVGLRESQSAAQELMKYLHARRRDIQAAVSAEVNLTEKTAPAPLSPSEIAEFKKIFEDVF